MMPLSDKFDTLVGVEGERRRERGREESGRDGGCVLTYVVTPKEKNSHCQDGPRGFSEFAVGACH